MEIFVCVKQVPDTNQVRVDETTGVLLRSGVKSKMNPYDLYALETALRLKSENGGRVVVGTMGPKQAESVLREAFLMGADAGYLISDRRFGGADVLATSYTLAQAVRNIGDFDLILLGRQTTDGDTAQVGPALAEQLGIPHASWVSELSVAAGGVAARQQLQDTVETVFMPFPCLVTVERDIYTPRLPSLKRRNEALAKDVVTLCLDDFMDKSPDHYGLEGSATQVERIFPPDNTVKRELWDENGAGDRLYERLRSWKFI